MGFLADFFGFSKKDEDVEWRGIICDPGIDTRPATNSYVTNNNAELERRLAHLTYMLNDYFKHIWGVVCSSPEEIRRFVDEQNKLLGDTITEYNKVRLELGLPYQPIVNIPTEVAYNNANTDLPVQISTTDHLALNNFEQTLALEKEKRKTEIELKKVDMEKELRKYELQLQVQSKNYELQLEVERLKIEVERLNYLLKYQS
jgi:hypothetical protein